MHEALRSSVGSVAAAALYLAAACSSTQADDRVCTPNAYSFCRCQNRDKGTKLCDATGKSFGECVKAGGAACTESEETRGRASEEEETRAADPDGGAAAQSSGGAVSTICGDGKLEGTEVCDDGNVKSLDGCNAKCSVVDALPRAGACPGQPVMVGTNTVTVQGSMAAATRIANLDPFLTSSMCHAQGAVGQASTKLALIAVTPRVSGRLSVSAPAQVAFRPLVSVLADCASTESLLACGSAERGLSVDVSQGRTVFLAVGGSTDPQTSAQLSLSLRVTATR